MKKKTKTQKEKQTEAAIEIAKLLGGRKRSVILKNSVNGGYKY